MLRYNRWSLGAFLRFLKHGGSARVKMYSQVDVVTNLIGKSQLLHIEKIVDHNDHA
jgi:hypothetical protein